MRRAVARHYSQMPWARRPRPRPRTRSRTCRTVPLRTRSLGSAALHNRALQRHTAPLSSCLFSGSHPSVASSSPVDSHACAAHFSTIAPTTARTTAGVVTYTVALFTKHGDVEERVVNGAELKSKLSLLSTDIIGFESGIRRSPIILPRERCTILIASHVKMIIGQDFALVFDYNRPVVKHFVEQLRYILYRSRFAGEDWLDAQDADAVGGPDDAKPTSASASAARAEQAGAATSTASGVPSFIDFLNPTYDGESTHLHHLANDSGLEDMPEELLQSLRDELVVVDPALPYELRILSAVLACICSKYRQRLGFMTPVLQDALAQIHSIHPRPEDLSQLLPLRNSLSAFETSVNETLTAIKTVLNDDEAMVAMLLSHAPDPDAEVDPNIHLKVEVPLENHYREFMVRKPPTCYLFVRRCGITDSSFAG